MDEIEKISSTQRWLVVAAVMSATLMQVIDTTIVNVALPHMQGSLSASPSEITWTLTSYMVSSAIFMPLTGYFTDRFGRRPYLIFSIAGFTLVSALCGASVSLTQMVLFRLLQGMFGAALVPLSQAIISDVFPKHEQGKAMAIWGIGVMVGPILGPTLGGYLTEYFSWRFTFYVNLPVGIFALLLTPVIPDTVKKIRRMDWLGLLLISCAVGGTQYVLDRGNQKDWFNSTEIQFVTLVTIIGYLGFILHSWQQKSKLIFDLRIFKDRNFTISCLLLTVFGLGLYGMLVVQPLMMETLLNYPVLTTGLVMAPRGISGMVGMMLVSKLIGRVDARWLIATGIIISGVGISVGTYFSLYISTPWLIWPLILQGLGLGMIFVPLSTLAFSTLSPEIRTEAAGLFSLVRTIGGSIGISVTITLYTRHAQMLWNQLGGYIQPYNTAVFQYLAPIHTQPNYASGAALLTQTLAQQSSMVSFINVFAFIFWSFSLMFPLVFLLRKQNNHGSNEVVFGE